MERVVLDLWRSLFQIEQLSIDANFFDLGGHSLLLVQMHKTLEQALNRTIPLANLFQHSTVRALARYLSGETAGTLGLRDFQQRAARQQSALAGLARLSRKN
jgi:acyl carrier protein